MNNDLQKRFDEAFALLQRIHTPAAARLEIEEIQAAEAKANLWPQEEPKLTDMLRRKDLRLALTAGIGIQVVLKTSLSASTFRIIHFCRIILVM